MLSTSDHVLQDVVITELGTIEKPWVVTVSLRDGTGHPDAALSGTLNVSSAGGWFNFTDLAISHMGNGYILDFNVTYPPEAVNFTLESTAFDLPGRPIAVNIVNAVTEVARDASFTLTFNLKDSSTGETISDIAWRVSQEYLSLCFIAKVHILPFYLYLIF